MLRTGLLRWFFWGWPEESLLPVPNRVFKVTLATISLLGAAWAISADGGVGERATGLIGGVFFSVNLIGLFVLLLRTLGRSRPTSRTEIQ